MCEAVRIALCSLALATGFAAPAGADGPLGTAEVRTFMAGIASAARDRDVSRLGAAMADDCRIELRTLVSGREEISLLTRGEYLEQLEGGYAALADPAHYDYRVTAQRISLEQEPTAATVISRVTETVSSRGRRTATASEETARLERRDGRLLLVAVSTLTRAGR